MEARAKAELSDIRSSDSVRLGHVIKPGQGRVSRAGVSGSLLTHASEEEPGHMDRTTYFRICKCKVVQKKIGYRLGCVN